MALLQVVPEVAHAVGQALALGLDRLLLRFRVEGEEVARRRRVDPLQHREADPRPRLLVGLQRLSAMPQQRAGVQQVHLGEIGAGRRGRPLAGGEAPVGAGARWARRSGCRTRFHDLASRRPGSRPEASPAPRCGTPKPPSAGASPDVALRSPSSDYRGTGQNISYRKHVSRGHRLALRRRADGARRRHRPPAAAGSGRPSPSCSTARCRSASSLYLLGTPARRRARRRAELASAEGRAASDPDGGGHAPGDAVAPVGKEP